MVGMKNADGVYWAKKVNEALEKIDWDVMNKHLHTRANRGRYEAAKKRAYTYFHWCISDVVKQSKEPTLAYYDRLIYAARKNSTTDNSRLLKKTGLLKGAALGLGGFAVGLAVGLASTTNKN